MTLDEAILHSEQIADSYKDTEPNCKCAKEHRQLTEWLKELKHLRVIELKQADDLISRADAIKVMACEMYAESQAQGYDVDSWEDFIPEARAWMNDCPSAQPDRGYIEQIKWERDLTIQQLADLGYSLGEKPRTNGDLISRQDAIETIRNTLADEMLSNALELRINDLPSARPTGRWIVSHGVLAFDGIYGDMWHCSECGLSERDVEGKNFCWNCGAKMEVEHE